MQAQASIAQPRSAQFFASDMRESIVEQPNFYAYSLGQRGTFYTLVISYGFGKGEAMQYSGRRR